MLMQRRSRISGLGMSIKPGGFGVHPPETRREPMTCMDALMPRWQEPKSGPWGLLVGIHAAALAPASL